MLAKNMNISKGTWQTAVRENVPVKVIDINELAFEKGYNFAVLA